VDTAVLLRALQDVEKRAERSDDDQHVLNTYVEAGALVSALQAADNGILYGRRGTGKTHALRYLAESERASGNFVIYLDVDKDVGSTEGIYADARLPVAERATRLLVDVIGLIHTALIEHGFATENIQLIETLDKIFDHMGEVVVADEAESETTQGAELSRSGGTQASAGIGSGGPTAQVSMSETASATRTAQARFRSTGPVRHRVHYGAVGDLMQKAIAEVQVGRFWILFDEWSSLPLDLQPYLGDALRRIFFAAPRVTVRIAAIPHRTEWRILRESENGYIGLEVGAELFPLLDLDEFVVFPSRSREEQISRASEFFRALLFRHLNHILGQGGAEALDTPEQMASLLFTQSTALQEMIRAAEGVPRDALSIVSRAALRAGEDKVSTDHIRDAAEQVYLMTKAALLNGVPAARALLDVIIRDVISAKKARAFLLAPDDTEHQLVQQLVDDRILHIIKRGYSSKDEPGVRYDVLQIDYGCYVQLLRTKSAPVSLFGESGPSDDMALGAMYAGASIDVPEDDYRAIRRAVLDLTSVLTEIGYSAS
jgi:hypothetical protein